MEVKVYKGMPKEAALIREEVFIKEQGCPHIWMEKEV